MDKQYPCSVTISLTEDEHAALQQLAGMCGIPAEKILRVEVLRFIAAHAKYLARG